VKNETGEKAYDTVDVKIIPDLLKGTTRTFNDVLWEMVPGGYDFELLLKLSDSTVFKGRLRHKLEVKIWDEQILDWIDSSKYTWWIFDNGNLRITITDENEIQARMNQIGKKTKVQVKFL
jgi:hypothetical protein